MVSWIYIEHQLTSIDINFGLLKSNLVAHYSFWIRIGWSATICNTGQQNTWGPVINTFIELQKLQKTVPHNSQTHKGTGRLAITAQIAKDISH